MKKEPAKILALALAWLALAGGGIAHASAHRRRPPSRKSPHVEILAVARVQSVPKKTIHNNRRAFEEFDVMILSARKTSEQNRASDSGIVIAQDRPVHIVHDLTCGGTWVDLKPGDQVELEGEYVHPPDDKDLIHFTHPADSACGNGEAHPDGYLKKKAAQVFRRYEGSRTLSLARAREALEDFADLEITRYPHEVFLSRIWDLRKNATAYEHGAGIT